MENHHAINGTIHYFDWAIFNCYVTVHQRVLAVMMIINHQIWWYPILRQTDGPSIGTCYGHFGSILVIFVSTSRHPGLKIGCPIPSIESTSARLQVTAPWTSCGISVTGFWYMYMYNLINLYIYTIYYIIIHIYTYIYIYVVIYIYICSYIYIYMYTHTHQLCQSVVAIIN